MIPILITLALIALGIAISVVEVWFWLAVVIYLAARYARRLAGISALCLYRSIRFRVVLAWSDFLIALLGVRDILERHRAFYALDPVFFRLL